MVRAFPCRDLTLLLVALIGLETVDKINDARNHHQRSDQEEGIIPPRLLTERHPW